MSSFIDHVGSTNSATPPSTPGHTTSSTMHGFQGPPTVPTTPVAPGQKPIVLFGCVMGSSDSRMASQVLSTGRPCPGPSSPLCAPSKRVTTAARHNATSLGSPLRLQHQCDGQGSGSRRALVRAAPAPIPLWQYLSPPPKGRSSSGESTVVLEGQTSDSEVFTHPGTLELSSSTPRTSTSFQIFNSDPSHDVEATEDMVPTAVVLAVLAALEDVVNEELGYSNSLTGVEPADRGYLGDRGGPLVGSKNVNPASIESCSADQFDFGYEVLPLTKTQGGEILGLPEVQYQVASAVPSLPQAGFPVLETGPMSPTTIDDTSYVFDDSWEYGWIDGLGDQPPPTGLTPNSIVSLDPSLLADIPKFNPHHPVPTNFNLLVRLGYLRDWPAVGVTKTELKRILKACLRCHRFMYADRRTQHRCEGPVLDVCGPGFNFVDNMLEFGEHSGFTVDDLTFLLFRCQGCLRLFNVTTEDGTLDPLVGEWVIHCCRMQS